METAKISKKGNGWEISYADGKKMSINWRNIPADWNNAEIQVKRINGQPVLLKKGDDEIKKPEPFVPEKRDTRDTRRNKSFKNYNEKKGGNNAKNADNSVKNISKHNNGHGALDKNPRSARSPYNFVPLNEKIIPSDVQDVKFDKYENGKNTGYIDIKIENKTPLFIRGNNADFIIINGKPVIPGSSMRGMIRSLVEIVSFSKMDFINDSRFYFRSFADSLPNLRDKYHDEINKQTKVGILFKKDLASYILVQSELVSDVKDESSKNTFFNKEDNIWVIRSGQRKYTIAGRNKKEPGVIIGRNETLIKEYLEDKNRKGPDVVKEAGLSKHSEIGFPVFYQTDTNGNVSSIGNTKNYRLPYTSKVKQHLYPDHLIDGKKDFASRIFGITDDKNSKETIAGRVFFEDSVCATPEFNKDSVLDILGTPNPTSFQLYLEQPDGVKTPVKKLRHWDDENVVIRGYKSYWHRITGHSPKEFIVKKQEFEIFLNHLKLQNPGRYIANLIDTHQALLDVYANGVEKLVFKGDLSNVNTETIEILKKYFFANHRKLNISSPMFSFIKALDSHNTFTGRIRFENLSNNELGALLFALDLPENCCHKIGLGKPYGLGTIRITPELVLQNRPERYSKILDNNGNWNLQERSANNDFKKEFAGFVCKSIGENSGDLWKCERFVQLKAMLEYDPAKQTSQKWLDETNYMDVKKEFRKREVLDNPKNIRDSFGK